jgi:hypothetical protein
VPWTPPTAWYIALFNVTPTSAGGGTEVATGSYVRQPVTFAPPTLGATSNASPVNFPVPSLDWGYLPGVALFDAATTGNMLYFGVLGTPRTVYAGEDLYFPAGYFSITES